MNGYPVGSDDKNVDEALQKAVGSNPITDHIVPDDTKHERYAIFGAVCDLKDAAQDMYCEGEMGWDDTMVNLSSAILKLKGKEEVLKKAHKKDMEDAEEKNETD